MQMARTYDHAVHAGNAGDVWKHFILAEAADHLQRSGKGLIYAESHVGRPQYILDSRGEWTGGIGRCWEHLPSLLNFCYFRVLSNLNPQGLRCYPGSARIVQEMARLRCLELRADIWDIDPEVEHAWSSLQSREKIQSPGKLIFHMGDGFSGVMSLLNSSPPGLLLIDPPYVDAADSALSENLLFKAKERGWIVLWWSMMGIDTAPRCDGLEILPLKFNEAGMECGRWEGAVVAVHDADANLVEHIRHQADAVADILKKYR